MAGKGGRKKGKKRSKLKDSIKSAGSKEGHLALLTVVK
jgi:hypothetical protein